MAGVDDEPKYPSGVLQLGSTQQHLVWGQWHRPEGRMTKKLRKVTISRTVHTIIAISGKADWTRYYLLLAFLFSLMELGSICKILYSQQQMQQTTLTIWTLQTLIELSGGNVTWYLDHINCHSNKQTSLEPISQT